MTVDPRTPVIVGVGQFTENIDEPGYRGMSAVELATDAARAALTDTGADVHAVATAIDAVVGLRQFEISGPMPAKLGKSNNYPRSVMQRLGAQPARSVLEPVGGQGPQKLVTEFCGAIANGEADVVMIIGSEPGSTARYFADRDDKPDFTEHVDGQLEDRGHRSDQYISEYTVKHGLTGAPVQYGLLDNARRARLGLSVDDYRQQMAELFAPFSKVAAKNPFSSSPVERSVEELDHRHRREPDDLRPVSAAAGRPRSGQPGCRRGADVGGRRAPARCARGEVGVPARPRRPGRAGPAGPRRSRAPAPRRCWPRARRLRVAGIGVDDIATFDLYSCFPFPVFVVCDALGLAADDPRGLTLTGGLPYFGGPGNSYSLHGIAETVGQMRDKPGRFGLVGANGGIMSKYSVGVYSTEPVDWRHDRSAELQRQIAALPTVPSPRRRRPRARSRPTRCATTGRCAPGSSSAGSMPTAPGSWRSPKTTDLVDLMSDGDPLGVHIVVTSTEHGNRARLA